MPPTSLPITLPALGAMHSDSDHVLIGSVILRVGAFD
jgi:hypothetical protein